MRKPQRKSLIVAVGLCWAIWVTTALFLPFGAVVPDNIKDEPHETANEQPKAAPISSVFRLVDFIDRHNGIVTAIATVFIAYFTLALKSVARDQHKIMEKQTKIIERQHIATHRPKLIVRNAELWNANEDPRTFVHFEVVNIGGSDATSYRSGVEAINVPIRPRKPYVLIGNEDFLGGESLSPGESTSYTHISPMLRNALAILEMQTRNRPPAVEVFVCRGIIAYNDENGVMRRTGFWREYDFGAQRFRPSDDPDYEYQD
jgi:hypothetical protein